MADWIKELDAILKDANLKVTFSKNCHSGIASEIAPDHKCGCWRCRESRGESWNEETEAQAGRHSKQAQESLKRKIWKQLEEHERGGKEVPSAG